MFSYIGELKDEENGYPKNIIFGSIKADAQSLGGKYAEACSAELSYYDTCHSLIGLELFNIQGHNVAKFKLDIRTYETHKIENRIDVSTGSLNLAEFPLKPSIADAKVIVGILEAARRSFPELRRSSITKRNYDAIKKIGDKDIILLEFKGLYGIEGCKGISLADSDRKYVFDIQKGTPVVEEPTGIKEMGKAQFLQSAPKALQLLVDKKSEFKRATGRNRRMLASIDEVIGYIKKYGEELGVLIN